MNIVLSRKGSEKVRYQSPYFTTEDFIEALPSEGTVVHLIDGKNSVGQAYVGQGHRYQAARLQEDLSVPALTKLFRRAYELRGQQFKLLPTAYCLVHSEADGLPGIEIEIYHYYASITYFNAGILKHEGAIQASLFAVLPHLRGSYRRLRLPSVATTEPVLSYGIPAPEELIIEETIGKYIVKLNEGLMTGLFLDQRNNRLWLSQNSENKHVCNTFSYTGSLSVACALGGSASTTSVDLSKVYSQYCRNNLTLNHLPAETNKVVVSDTFDHFNYCERKRLKYDMIILDPPTFSKKKKGSFSVPDNYHQLITQASRLLTENGTLVCSTNYSQWTQQAFAKLIKDTLARNNKQAALLYQSSASQDFPVNPHWPESQFLKFVAVAVK
ncbi:class I SAM-dependent rRNA methyltransferase [Candidatus Gracilibacteria bacterium]|nr:class I SAM-dependent rRNA methyltransferase [Candidatus Gracilibacteria bacterium]